MTRPEKLADEYANNPDCQFDPEEIRGAQAGFYAGYRQAIKDAAGVIMSDRSLHVWDRRQVSDEIRALLTEEAEG